MLRLLFLPFGLLWWFVFLIFKILGNLLSAIFGLGLVLTGAILTATIVGAVVGVPFIVIGSLLLICSIF
ncbi:hypothetical protein V6615_11135 [Oscillospiraceae bacterium PP1C4]